MSTSHNTTQCCTLDEAIRLSDTLQGVTLSSLSPSDTIRARTLNSNYEISLLDPQSGHVLLKGGKSFVEPVDANVNGSTFGGWMIKLGWLGVGLRMEFSANGQRFVTTPVSSLEIEHAKA
jgi:hypothetical protein